jgi:predicted nucleic acid-binding protein
MNADVVLDTNVLVYAVSAAPEEAAKKQIALGLLDEHLVGLSGQILQEFYVTVTRKNRRVLTSDEALDWIESFEDLPIVPVDAALVRNGAEIASRFQVSYWDGAVIAAAQRLGAQELYSEHLNHGQIYGTVQVINPFRSH